MPARGVVQAHTQSRVVRMANSRELLEILPEHFTIR